jgi:hypothetical protein
MRRVFIGTVEAISASDAAHISWMPVIINGVDEINVRRVSSYKKTQDKGFIYEYGDDTETARFLVRVVADADPDAGPTGFPSKFIEIL